MKINKGIELQLLNLNQTDELFSLVNANRAYLKQWLPWLDANRSPRDTEAFIQSAISQYESGKGPQYAVTYNSAICGVCGFHPFDKANKIGGIGYWLAQAYSGKGIMTLAIKALIAEGFEHYELNRIEIACATNNLKSRAIAEQLGFTFEGVLRERERLYGKYIDHAIYSLLLTEYTPSH